MKKVVCFFEKKQKIIFLAFIFQILFLRVSAFAVCTVGDGTGLVNVIASVGTTGTTPFDSDPADVTCAAGSTLHTEGLDCSANNYVVRIGQQTIYPVTVTTSGNSDSNIQIKLNLTNGTWGALPAVCLAGSTTSNNTTTGISTLTCNLGTGSAILGGGTGIGSGVINFTATNWTGSSRTQQQTLQTVAVSTCHTGNLSTNTSGSGITMAQAANVEISARLAQPELIKTSRDAVYAPNGLYFVKSGVVGRELTFFPQIFDKGVGAFAESPLSSSLSFQDTLTPAGVPYEMIATGLDNAGGTQPGGAGTPLNLSFVGPYTLSTTPPLTTFLGGPLPAGVNYNVGTYRYGFVQLFIPETYIAANCPLNYTNTFNLFNPKDRDGNLLGTDDPSNNFVTGSLTCTAPATPGAGPSTMGVTPQQSNNSATSGASTLGANETYFNNGSIPAGVFTGGEFEYNYIIRKSIPPVIVPQTFTNHILCLSNMTPTLHWFEDYPGQSSGTKAGPRDWSLSNVDSYTYATADLGAFDPYAYQVEYGIQGVGGSVPSNGTCDDGDATWYSSSSAVPGGVKNANKVRVKIPSYTCRINPNSNTEQGVYCRTNYTTHMRVSSTAVSGGTVASGSLPAGDRPYVYYTWKDDGAWKNTSGWGAAVTTALKTYSTSAGAAIPPTNNGGAGNYVLVKSAVARVTKNVATNFGTVCTSSGASAPCDVLTGSNYTYDYNLQPTFTGPGLPALQDSLKITDTLPSGVIYVSGSSKVGGVVTAPNQIVSNPDGSTTLVWILPNQIANTALPAITFKAYVSPTYSNGVVFTNKANIYSKYDPQSGTTDTEVYANVRTLVIGGFSVQKRATPLAQEITANTNIDFKLQYANTTTSSSLTGGVDMIDILPYNGDARVPPSSFTGTFTLRGYPTNAGDPSMIFYYTNRIQSSISQTTEQYTAPVQPQWCLVSEFGLAGCPSSLANVTAIRARSSTTLTPGYQGEVSVPAVAIGATPGNVFSNVFTARQPSIHLDPSYILPTGNVKSSVVKLGSLSGYVFGDENLNNVMNTTAGGIPGSGDLPLSNVSLTLTGTTSTGSPLSMSTTTNANGYYLFNNVPSGTYTIVETQPTGLYEGVIQAGSSGGNVSSTSTTSVISNIALPMSTDAVGYNFGEQKNH